MNIKLRGWLKLLEIYEESACVRGTCSLEALNCAMLEVVLRHRASRWISGTDDRISVVVVSPILISISHFEQHRIPG